MEERSDSKTDQELVTLALQNHYAFVAIVERYQAALRRYLARMGCYDPFDQDDVLQETFLKIYLNLNDYDPDLKFSSFGKEGVCGAKTQTPLKGFCVFLYFLLFCYNICICNGKSSS